MRDRPPKLWGRLRAYAKLNREMVWYELGTNRLPKPLILGPLVTSLELFVHFYDKMIPHLEKFAALCEREIEKRQPAPREGQRSKLRQKRQNGDIPHSREC